MVSVFSQIRDLTLFSMRRAKEERLGQVAGSLTFTTVLSLVPLFAVALALFSAFPLFDSFRLALQKYLIDSLLPANISNSIIDYLNMFARQAKRLTAVGIAFLIVTAISLMLTIDKALNDIWHVNKRRPLTHRVLVYWTALTIGPLVLGSSLWATSYLTSMSIGLVGELPWFTRGLLVVIPIVLTALAFAGLFIWIPNCSVAWQDALVGGLIVALMFEIMKRGFAFYITQFPTYTRVYGTFAAFPIFLLWVYLSWMVTLCGATIAASLPALKYERWYELSYPGGDFVDGLTILHYLLQDYYHMTKDQDPSSESQISVTVPILPGVSVVTLQNVLRLNREDLDRLLEKLAFAGYIARVSDNGNEPRWVIACHPEKINLLPLVDALLIDRNQPKIVKRDYILNALNQFTLIDEKLTLAQSLGYADLSRVKESHQKIDNHHVSISKTN